MIAAFLVLQLLVTVCSKLQRLQEIDIPALGRPFSLGDLYDRRRDYIIAGPKLWTHEELNDYTESPSPSSDFHVTASQSINEDMTYFKLGASLKMSFLSGLISVSGSASYLNHRKRKNNQARVSLNYKSTSFKRELKPELFTKVSLPRVLKNAEDATDVVVAILYGAGAIFSFDKAVLQNEITKDIEGALRVIVKKVPEFTVDGSGKVIISEADRKKGENLSCTFHGDFVLKTHPGTFEEAIRVYKSLPKLLGEKQENSVPVKVWLYPLEKLPIAKSPQVFHQIRESMITSVTNIVSDLEKVVRTCNDILDSPVSDHHSRIRVKVRRFHDYVKRYVVLFKQQMAVISPEVRKGNLPVSVFSTILSKKESSPFSKDKLEEWISYYSEEVHVLSRIQSLPNYCVGDGDFSSKLLTNVRHTVGLTLKLGPTDDDYLTTLDKYLLEKKTNEPTSNKMRSKWWVPGSPILSDLLALSRSFRKCYELRKSRKMLENSGIQFLVREETLSGDDKQGISIELYEQGILKDKKYELASSPSIPKYTSKTHDSISLVWDNPEKGLKNLFGFKVITYVMKKNDSDKGCVGIYCKIGETLASNNFVNITGLKSQYPYYFTVSAYTNIGETSISDMTDEIITTKCSPGTFQIAKHECQKCDPGKFSDKFGMTSCNTCPSGTYNPKYGAKSKTECITCPSGTYNTHEDSRDIKDCIPCGTGTFSTEIGATSPSTCQKCDMGTFNSKEGAIKCTKCTTSSYNPSVGKSECLKCPIGTESKVQGATSLSQCLPLDPATVLDRKIDALDSTVSTNFKDIKDTTLNIEKHITTVLESVNEEEKAIAKEIVTKGSTLRKEFDAIHGCKWMSGEGISNKPSIRIDHIAYTKESCVYNCLKLRKKYPLINGVTRKLSTRKCQCIQQMIGTAPTFRYQACMIYK